MKFYLVLCLIWISSLEHVYAQNDQSSSNDSTNIRDFYMDFTAPSITAFSLLGVEPTEIARPGNLKEFALGLTNYVSKTGDLKAGLAIEWAPFMTFNKKTSSWVNRPDRNNKFEWKNLTFSFASANDSTNLKLGTAFRWSPIDRTNPLNDKEWTSMFKNLISNLVLETDNNNRNIVKLERNFNTKVSDTLLSFNVNIDILNQLIWPIDIYLNTRVDTLLKYYNDVGALVDRKRISHDIYNTLDSVFRKNGYGELFNSKKELMKSLSDEFTDLLYLQTSKRNFSTEYGQLILKKKAEFKKKNWNKLAVQVSGGSVFNSEKSSLTDLNGQYLTFAATSGFPLIPKKWVNTSSKIHDFLRNNSQLLLQIKVQQYLFKDSINLNTIFTGGRLLLGNVDKRFSLELAYVNQQNTVTGIHQEGIRWSLGTEIKVMDNFWLELALGGQTFVDQTNSLVLPRFSFRHAFGNENRYFKK